MQLALCIIADAVLQPLAPVLVLLYFDLSFAHSLSTSSRDFFMVFILLFSKIKGRLPAVLGKRSRVAIFILPGIAAKRRKGATLYSEQSTANGPDYCKSGLGLTERKYMAANHIQKYTFCSKEISNSPINWNLNTTIL